MPETQLNWWGTQPTAPVQQPTAPVQQPTAPVQQPTTPVPQQEKPRIYYHPSWLTKIVSWILRTYWIIMTWIWLLNLSIIFSNPENLDTIICCWWGFLLYGIGLIFAWSLFYNNKKWMHLWVSFLVMLLVNIFWSIVFWEYWWDFDDFDGDNYFFILWFFIQIYFLIVTIVWLIKCLIYKKKWASQKALDPRKDSKKTSYITLAFLFMLIIIDVIYGKILFSRIPESDISSFNRVDHIKQLAEWEDWVAIFKAKEKNGEVANIWTLLDGVYLNRFNPNVSRNSDDQLSWRGHPDECIKVYSWGQAYCWTWALSESSLKRLFKNQLGEDYIRYDITLSWKVQSLYSYLEEREPEIRAGVLEMSKLLSKDYYAEDWLKNDLMPQNFQSYTRWSIVLIGYYSLKKDWNMVLKLVENDFKMADVANNFWGLVWVLIWNVIVENTYSNLNNLLQTFPEEIRIKLVNMIKDNHTDYNDIIKYIMQWEIENGNAMIKEVSEGYKYDWWLNQVLYHYPFYSESDSKRLLNNFYNTFNNFLNEKDVWDVQDFYQNIFDGESNFRWSIYNIQGLRMLMTIAPRLQWATWSIKRTYVHEESLLKNLESWKYDSWYYEPDWNSDPYYYKDNVINE